MIAVAPLGEVAQRPAHLGDLAGLDVQGRDVSQGQPLDVGTRPLVVAPECEQVAHLSQPRKSEAAGAGEEAQRLNVRLVRRRDIPACVRPALSIRPMRS